MPEGENFVPEEPGEAAPEAKEGEPTIEEILEACKKVLSPEILGDIQRECGEDRELVLDNVTTFLIDALGGDDAAFEFLAEKGLLE